MNPSRPFILRPIATSLLMVAIVLAGLLAYRLLPVSALPAIDFPTIQVTAAYPGASPEVVTASITAPLERQFGQMPGLARMSSISSPGAVAITLRFALEVPLDVAEQQVQAAINAAAALLPNDLPLPPVYSKVNPADAPVLTLAVTSKTMPMARVRDLIESRLAMKIAQIPGVGLVGIAGGQRPAIRIRVNPRQLAAMGLSLEDLRGAIAAANVNESKGNFDGALRASTIDANDQLLSAAEFAAQPLAWKNGAAIRIGDIATVADDAENVELAAWANRTPAIVLNIQRQPGANVIAVADRIKAALPQLRAALPGAIDVELLGDRTQTIRASIADVRFDLMLAIALVVMVIFVFLRNLPATLIPSVAVPISLLGTFGVMLLAGFSVNNLTMMALTIATGFVVDDAIVMIENIARHLEAGASPRDAALAGAKEIGFTIISLTVSLLAVLIPLLFMGDVVGRLFHEFAVTLAAAILISAVVSLTATPMMCAQWLRPHDAAMPPSDGRTQRLLAPVSRLIERTIAAYGRALDWVLARQRETLIVATATLVASVALYAWMPKGLFPLQDTGIVQITTEADQAIAFAEMTAHQQQLAAALLQDPAVASVTSLVGVDGTNTAPNTGRMLVNLKPLTARDPIAVVMPRLAARARGVAGLTAYLQPVQDLTIDDQVARTQYQFRLSSPVAADVGAAAGKLFDRLRTLPELADVASDWQDRGRAAYVEIDRDAAARAGVTVAAIDNALYNAFGQRLVSTVYTQSNQYRVVLDARGALPPGPDALTGIYVPGTGGAQVPLAAVARWSEKPTPLSIAHLDQFPAATLSFNLADGVALGDAVAAIRVAAAQLGLPASVETRFEGAAQTFEASQTNTALLVLAAIVTMYIVLGVLYESYLHPITILSTLPSAGVGALLALWLTGADLDVIGVIGVILLIGIVKKNAIMMIDFALDAQRNRGLRAHDAIREACLLRFRPILMTTLSALFAAVPLALGGGFGAELRAPLGVAMIGGLLVSQLLTLFTTPVIYLAFDRLAQRRAQRAP